MAPSFLTTTLSAALVMSALAMNATLLSADSSKGLSDAEYALFKKVDTCSQNGGGHIETFAVDEFNVATALHALQENDRNAAGPDCSAGRIYANSVSDGIRLFKQHIKQHKQTSECLKEALSKAELAELNQLFANPKNLAVLASLYTRKNDNAEGCQYYIFEIYRGDGVKVVFEFNYTN